MAYTQHKDLVTDIFAGRLWENQPSAAVTAMRRLLKRERTLPGLDEDYSVPIGSRYHPERARIWEVGDPRVGIDVAGDLILRKEARQRGLGTRSERATHSALQQNAV